MQVSIKFSFLLIVIFAFFASCKTSNNSVGVNNNDSISLVISYYQTPGHSPTKPEFKIELYSNKQMFLTASKNLDRKGKFMRTLTQEEFDQIISAFIDAKFFKFNNKYTDTISNLPTRYIEFNHNGKSKKIEDYYGAPVALSELELMVKSYLDRVGWSKISW